MAAAVAGCLISDGVRDKVVVTSSPFWRSVEEVDRVTAGGTLDAEDRVHAGNDSQ